MKPLLILLLWTNLCFAQTCPKPLELNAQCVTPNYALLSCDGITTTANSFIWYSREIGVTRWTTDSTFENYILLQDLLPMRDYIVKVLKQCNDTACPCHYSLSKESDSILVSTPPAPPIPNTVTMLTSSSVRLRIVSALPYATSYKYYYRKVGANSFSSKNVANPTALVCPVSNLSSGTNYEWYVVSVVTTSTKTILSQKSLSQFFKTL